MIERKVRQVPRDLLIAAIQNSEESVGRLSSEHDSLPTSLRSTQIIVKSTEDFIITRDKKWRKEQDEKKKKNKKKRKSKKEQSRFLVKRHSARRPHIHH